MYVSMNSAKLAEWVGVHPQTAYRWFREGRMPVPARRLGSGTIWVDAAPSATSGRVVVVRDMIEVLTSMCARLYGRRGARNRAVRAVTATKTREPESGRV